MIRLLMLALATAMAHKMSTHSVLSLSAAVPLLMVAFPSSAFSSEVPYLGYDDDDEFDDDEFDDEDDNDDDDDELDDDGNHEEL